MLVALDANDLIVASCSVLGNRSPRVNDEVAVLSVGGVGVVVVHSSSLGWLLMLSRHQAASVASNLFIMIPMASDRPGPLV